MYVSPRYDLRSCLGIQSQLDPNNDSFPSAFRMYIRYSLSKKSETNEDEFPFSARALSSWDYTLSKPEGAALRTKAIVTNTKVRRR